ncbi:syntaxin-18-like isoform X2 [Eriocheir sinensis]|uniref:syntaxin-18-like isoform X2 n=1 Tax=Eriocheir sinensis TaxID=95602 RepID=UPI0021C8527C|nr:syntaxin-18-like isoform X2 [Eriocheir sinensis]
MTVESNTSADLTTLFKSCVKTIRTRNKAIGVTLPQTKIFPSPPTPASQFYSRARDVMSNISSHRNLLQDHRKKYLQYQDHSMTDYERSYMEKVVKTNLRIIDDNIRTLSSDLQGEQQGSKDAQECQQNIMAILRMNFQGINSTFKHMKELRKKRQKEKDNLYRLQRPSGSRKRTSSGSEEQSRAPHPALRESLESSRDALETSQSELWGDWPESPESDQLSQDGNQDRDDKESTEGSKRRGPSDAGKKQTSYLEDEMDKMLGELSPEERQMLEEENDHLYKELQSNHEEVRQITKQVVELGQMQDLLSENVELQATQIDKIQETIIAATENVREGNEQVREAMRKDAGFRVWIMFFLIVMSCTILFLDWYNS